MSTKIKYLSRNDQYNYFIDRLVINHTALVSRKYVKHIIKNKNSIYIRELKSHIRFIRKGDNVLISFKTTHNLNRIITDFLLEKYDIPKAPSLFTHDNNYIPIYVRRFIKKEKISFSDLREVAARVVFQELTEGKNILLKRIWGDRGPIKFKNLSTAYSVDTCEICYDIMSPDPIEFCKDDELKKSFDRNLDCTSQGKIIGSKGETSFAIKSIKEELDSGRHILKGYCSDNSEVKVYTKEISMGKVINRFERTFSEYAQIAKQAQTTKLETEKELLHIFHCLAAETFETYFFVANIPLEFSSKTIRKITKQNCRLHFGKYYIEAYHDLTRGTCSITTGKDGKSLLPVQYKARSLAREGIFLKCIRKGVYVVNNHKIRKPSYYL